jgi:hypothetical protein
MRRIIKLNLVFDAKARLIPTTQEVVDEAREYLSGTFTSDPRITVISTTEAGFVDGGLPDEDEDDDSEG